jgi:pimeloyl-ACP methyl ester carboxylesterase
MPNENGQTLDIWFRGQDDEAVDAYIVLPGSCVRAGIVFSHPHEPGDRRFFLEEAVQLAGDGYASILPNSPFRRPPFPPLVTWAAEDGELHGRAIEDLESGLAVIHALVEDGMIPVFAIGRAYGAGSALHLAARHPEIRAVVAISPLASRSEFWNSDDPIAVGARGRVSEDQFSAFLRAIDPYDAIDAFPAAGNTPLLIQGTASEELDANRLGALSTAAEVAIHASVNAAEAEMARRDFIQSVLDAADDGS